MFSPRSTSANMLFHENRSVFTYSRPSWRNQNNNQPSVSQTQAPGLGLRGPYFATPLSPSLEMKRQHHPAHENITNTRKLVNFDSPGHETVASYSRWTAAEGHPSQDQTQLVQGTNLQEHYVSTSSRHDTLPTLRKLSSNERPDYLKFTFGVPVPSFLFPQQVSFPGDSPRRNNGQYSADSSFRSSTSSCSDLDSSFSPTVRYHVDSETLFGDTQSRSRHRPVIDPRLLEQLRPPPGIRKRNERLSTSSFPPGKPDYSKFKMEQRGIQKAKEKHEVTKQQRPDPSSVSGYFPRRYDSPPSTPGYSEMDSSVFLSSERSRSRSQGSPPQSSPDQFEGNPRLKKIEVDKSIHFTPPSPSSPSSDGRRERRKLNVDESFHFTPPTPPSPPQEYYGLDDEVDSPAPQRRRLVPASFLDTSSGSDSPGSDNFSPGSPMRRGGRGGTKSPRCNLNAEFTQESPAFGKVQSITSRDFDRFISNQDLAVVMFYDSTKNSQDTMNIWARESLKPNPTVPNPAYASVDCAMESDLCAREKISSYPLYKLYAGGSLVNAVKHFKLLNLDS